MSFIGSIQGQALGNPSRFFLRLILQEVRANSNEVEEREFLKAVGRDLAVSIPLDEDADLAGLEHAVNAIWRGLEIGSVEIGLIDDAILIRHTLPRDEAFDADWTAALPAILEGAYDTWLRALGSGPRLKTTRLSANAEAVEFRHGL